MQTLDAPQNGHSPQTALGTGKQITIGEGFSAKSYKHTDFSGLMDPLVMVDHFVMTEPTFGTHPHAGLSAVTIVFEDSVGVFRNQDSLGNDIDLAPGDLYWFKAGRGAIHNEQPRPGSKTHALQVFVGLPAPKRYDAPSAFHLAAKDIPLVFGDRAKARVVLGESQGTQGATAPDISLTLLDIHVQSNGSFSHSGGLDRHTWLLAVAGSVKVTWNAGQSVLQPGDAIAMDGAADISISSETDAHAVLFEGSPLRETFVQNGPFVMGSAAELDALEADYRAGRLGSIEQPKTPTPNTQHPTPNTQHPTPNTQHPN